ncbi:MAG TPA: DUF983 domain-containing protein [Caulobacteraceae bacterium]
MAGVNPVLAGLACRCPNCGEGPLFAGFLRIIDHCEACGADLSSADTGDGPAVFVILIGGCIACFGLLFTYVAFRPPIWLELLIWPPLGALLCLALLRPFKAILFAMQFHHKAAEGRLE